ncbi:MAG TPA: flagellar biosynthesis protein FlhF [Phycisphaerales bacterium]|nr:flagellar biosynthesis protein FlhF [Phycisphaerales bacterium]
MTTTIRTFRARTPAEALKQVRDSLGPGAIILHTRTFKTGGLFGFRAKSWTEITASAARETTPVERAAQPRSVLRAAAPISAPRAQAVRPQASNSRAQAPTPAPVTSTPKPQSIADRPEAGSRKSEAPRSSDPPSLRDEMATIKRLVGHVLQSSRGSRTPGIPDALFEHYLRLIESEVAAELADEIVARVRHDLRPEQLAQHELVRGEILRRLAAHIPVAECDAPTARPSDGRPLTIALVGPTGVGKTTTIAKLAATYRLRQRRRVGLITCDTFRIAAVDQLRSYAEIIGLPLKVVMTPAEMSAACASLAGFDIVLIDTAGRAPTDAARLEELRAILNAADPHQTHLVLSSVSSEAVMCEAAERFAPLTPPGSRRVVFTKLDEAVNFGMLLSVARRIDAKLSFITTGQEVPDQIEPGDASRLASLIYEGRSALSNVAAVPAEPPAATVGGPKAPTPAPPPKPARARAARRPS